MITATLNSKFAEMSDSDIQDAVSMKISQMDALSSSIVGDGFEVFTNWSEDIQHNLLWLISDLSTSIRAFRDELDERSYKRIT